MLVTIFIHSYIGGELSFGTLSSSRPGSGAGRDVDDMDLTAATSKEVSGSDLTRP